MLGMDLVDAVRSFPQEPSGAAWIAGPASAAETFNSENLYRVKNVLAGRYLTESLNRLRAHRRRVQCGLARIHCQDRQFNTHVRRPFFQWGDVICAAAGSVLELRRTGGDFTDRRKTRERQLASRTCAERHQSFRQALARDLLSTVSPLAHGAGGAVPAMRPLMPRLASLAALQDCLAFEGERVNVTNQPFEPRRLVAGAVSALADEAPSPGCGIASVIAAEVPRRVTGDPALVRQLIERLAGPPMGEGNGICIRISAQAGRLLLSFEAPWPRAPGQGAAPGDLALAAVRPVVEALRGELAVQRSDGAASVRVEIPAPAAGETAGDAERGAVDNRPSPGILASRI